MTLQLLIKSKIKHSAKKGKKPVCVQQFIKKKKGKKKYIKNVSFLLKHLINCEFWNDMNFQKKKKKKQCSQLKNN